jgi:hypothetical protein
VEHLPKTTEILGDLRIFRAGVYYFSIFLVELVGEKEMQHFA